MTLRKYHTAVQDTAILTRWMRGCDSGVTLAGKEQVDTQCWVVALVLLGGAAVASGMVIEAVKL